MHNYPCVLSIAGSDPSGGAGIQADIKAISATGAYAAAVITTLTAQNTQGVQAIQAIPAEFITRQLHAIFSDLSIAAIKIGMLHDESTMLAVIKILQQFDVPHVILDPVMIAKSGAALFNVSTLALLKEKLLPHITLITPNRYEAEQLFDSILSTENQMAQLAKHASVQFNLDVLIKGGHMDGAQSSDVLFERKVQTLHWLRTERILSKNTHGTGCTLSSAIASYLAQGYATLQAVKLAKNYVTQAIQSGKDYSHGQGHGSLDHFFYLRNDAIKKSFLV